MVGRVGRVRGGTRWLERAVRPRSPDRVLRVPGGSRPARRSLSAKAGAAGSSATCTRTRRRRRPVRDGRPGPPAFYLHNSTHRRIRTIYTWHAPVYRAIISTRVSTAAPWARAQGALTVRAFVSRTTTDVTSPSQIHHLRETTATGARRGARLPRLSTTVLDVCGCLVFSVGLSVAPNARRSGSLMMSGSWERHRRGSYRHPARRLQS